MLFQEPVTKKRHTDNFFIPRAVRYANFLHLHTPISIFDTPASFSRLLKKCFVKFVKVDYDENVNRYFCKWYLDI